jgi:hypothetical protein
VKAPPNPMQACTGLKCTIKNAAARGTPRFINTTANDVLFAFDQY